ncbi:hypothetical protein LPB86_16160 [Pedobacter sp. MC2016-14]|uniref:hypothetical protein n=1 Tax=Pedobacter sp. MC2016-14 TaxID=2897327 RepID=UPI001E3E2C5E|nr:hypothetical protein [Pedobacter sp. MC2016-14]MCD0489778.1 hypothetical protein [Pedobacter sp. MC2016-14]
MKKQLLTLGLLVFATVIHAQTTASKHKKAVRTNFNVPIRDEYGDLNRDGLPDKVIVMMDTSHVTVPLKLQIFFGQPGGKFKSILSSTQLIEAQYPTDKKGKHNGFQIPDFNIEDGNLQMLSDRKDGNAMHTFRYQNGNFELIYAWQIKYDGKNSTTEKIFDLVTGKRFLKTEPLGPGKAITTNKPKQIIRPLPKIQNLSAADLEFYL